VPIPLQPPRLSPKAPGFGCQGSQSLKLLRAETVFQMALGDLSFSSTNKKEEAKKFIKKAEKGKSRTRIPTQ